MGRVEELPVKLKTTHVQERHLVYIYIRCKGQTPIRRRSAGDIWQGLWEPVLLTDKEPFTFHHAQWVLLAKDVKHVLTHRILWADFYFIEVTEKPPLPEGFIWIDEAAWDDYAKPRLVELLLERVPSSQ